MKNENEKNKKNVARNFGKRKNRPTPVKRFRNFETFLRIQVLIQLHVLIQLQVTDTGIGYRY